MVGAAAVFLFFSVVADSFLRPSSLSTVLYAASTIGIMAVPVALLMIGGEFDLSAGVLVTTSALVSSMFSYQMTANVWVGVGVSLLVTLAIGAFNGFMLTRTKLPSFIITLGTFLMLTGLNLGFTKLISGTVSTKSIADMEGFESAKKLFASQLDHRLRRPEGHHPVVGRADRGGHLDPAADPLRQLDLRGRRRARTRPARSAYRSSRRRSASTWASPSRPGSPASTCCSRYDVVQSGEGVGNELIYIIAAVIGGCLITGGYGSAIGSAVGAFIFGMTSKGIVYAEWNPDWFKFFLGAMLLLATLLNAWVRKRAEATA